MDNKWYLTAQYFATVYIQQRLKEHRIELLSDRLLVFDDRSLSDLSVQLKRSLKTLKILLQLLYFHLCTHMNRIL